MSKYWQAPRIALQYSAGIIGVALLVVLVSRAGPEALLENVRSIGWGLAAIIGLGGLAHLLKAWGWRLTLPGDIHYSLPRIFGLRLVSEAIGQLGFAGTLVGDAARVKLLGSETPVDSRVLSVTLDRGLFIACGAVVTVCGITAGLVLFSISNTLRLYAAAFAFLFLGILITAVLAINNRWPLLTGPARALGCLPLIGSSLRKRESLISSVEQKLQEFHRERPWAFWGSVVLNLLCHALAITEVYLILLFMGKNGAWARALILEAFTKLINVAGALTPGNVGVYEGGTMLMATLFGLSASAGLTLGLCRRVRSLFWTFVGILAYFAVSRSAPKENTSPSLRPVAGSSASPLKESLAKSTGDSSSEKIAAIIFADAHRDIPGFTPEFARVGALAIILRAILQAQNANAYRIVVATRGLTPDAIRSELKRTKRLPKAVEWLEIDSVPGALPELIGQIATESDRILLISGHAAYHPSLFETIVKSHAQAEAVALTSGGQFVGIAALSAQSVLDVARSCRLGNGTLFELYELLEQRTSIAFESVGEELWQSVDTPRDRLSAEQKLDGWLVKPTDGLFARMNRKISIPISRQLIKFPITPNMVTLFTLGVSFLAGGFFALGGYWNTLLGAILSVWASILDGSDGEVARLKLQSSKFGCWLETVCDYLYYLFIFAGMSLGLTKSRGTEAYLVWGGFLLFGAVASFLAVSSARHRFAAEHPEKFLDLWQKKADKQTTNPLMYLARNTEFIIRRCFLPYALLAFAAINLIRFAFIGSAVGANIVWIVALYSYYRLSKPLPSVPALGLNA